MSETYELLIILDGVAPNDTTHSVLLGYNSSHNETDDPSDEVDGYFSAANYTRKLPLVEILTITWTSLCPFIACALQIALGLYKRGTPYL